MSNSPDFLAAAVRRSRPLVQCITNYVSMDVMANILLAAGASPAMVHSENEVADFAAHASALLINTGTLDAAWVAGMEKAAAAVTAANKPWVLDPVACGATPHRAAVAAGLARLRPTVVKGNGSEIVALAAALAVGSAAGGGRGVDSTLASTAAVGAAAAVAGELGCVVVVTGAVDCVVPPPPAAALAVRGGSALLPLVTATGCSLGALIAAYLAAAAETCGGAAALLQPDADGSACPAARAAAAACAVYGVAAETAEASGVQGPASFRTAFIDRLHSVTEEEVKRRARVETV